MTTSIKHLERCRRASFGTLVINIANGEQKVPKQWKKFLSNEANKDALLLFLAQEWCKDQYAMILGQHTVFYAFRNQCYQMYARNGQVVTEVVDELETSQEEADTRMFLHAKHAADRGRETVIVKSPDTDVSVLACHMQKHIPTTLLIHTGTGNSTRLVDVQAICDKLGPEVCDALPGVHAFTGCDTTSP